MNPSADRAATSGASTSTAASASASTFASAAKTAAEFEERQRRSVWRRGVRSLVFGLVVATCLSVLLRQNFWRTLVYSLFISSLCWASIDGGRAMAVRWLAHRAALRGDPTAPDKHWPGFRWMVAIVVVGALFGSAVGTGFGNLLTGRSFPKTEALDLHGLLSFLIVSLIPAALVTYLYHSREVLATQRQKAAVAERLAAENRLRLLESQLEPHMLFNTLANLRVLIGLDAERAQAMLDRLIAFLRSTLSASRVGLHPLASEFDRLRDYLALIEIRMGARLQTRLELPRELEAAMVPPLLLQPLVENAVKHGLEPHVEGGRIDVSAALDGPRLVLTVRDTGVGLATSPDEPARRAVGTDRFDRFDLVDLDAEGEGEGDGEGEGATRFGLAQIRERLSTLYGGAASFELRNATDGAGGTIAVIRLPHTPGASTP